MVDRHTRFRNKWNHRHKNSHEPVLVRSLPLWGRKVERRRKTDAAVLPTMGGLTDAAVLHTWRHLYHGFAPTLPPRCSPILRLRAPASLQSTLDPGVYTIFLVSKLLGCWESWGNGLAAVSSSSWWAGRTPEVAMGTQVPDRLVTHEDKSPTHSQACKHRPVLCYKQWNVCYHHWGCFSLL